MLQMQQPRRVNENLLQLGASGTHPPPPPPLKPTPTTENTGGTQPPLPHHYRHLLIV